MTGILRNLLVATDGSDNGNRAVSFALAVARQNDGNLLLCHVIDRAGAIGDSSAMGGGIGFLPILQSLEESAASILTAAAKRATDAGVVATTTVIDGGPAEAVVACAKERRVDAIVMGTQGKRGLERFFLGSTADGVLRRTDVPVFVVPPGASIADSVFERILVAVDDSDPSDAAAAFALNLAEAEAQLVFCAVTETSDLLDKTVSYGYDPKPMLEELRERSAGLLAAQTDRARKNNVAFESVVAEGDPAEEILKVAATQHVGLVIVGTHGRRGLRRLFVGSVAENVVRRSPVPVAVVRASDSRASRATGTVGATTSAVS